VKSVYNFIIQPTKSRYNNTKKIGDKEIIVNTDIFQHQFVSREAKVVSVPTLFKTDINVGDTIIVHHNVFRRYTDIKGIERDSKAYYKDNLYFVFIDQIFAYKRNNKWTPLDDYCFVKPIKPYDMFDTNKEQALMGVIKYTNKNLPEVGSLVGFTPNSEYEFIIDNERLYRVRTKDITIKYEYQGKEEEYNPSWL
tara:strand:- start:1042 stop:1626 length:585 start_codon:yes stop_codon:yes gene_type:complete